jgi:hypothetical protein
VAFHSDESGINQVFVKPFPSGSGKWQASTSGGIFSRWRRDGRELFFMENSDFGRMMSVDVKFHGDSVEFGQPRPLFDTRYVNVTHGTNYHTYAVSPDGQRFLVPRPLSALRDDSATQAPISVALNWTALLKRK